MINSGIAEENANLRKQAASYLNALMLVYDEIFEFNPERETVRRLHRGKRIGDTKAYPMREAEIWIGNNILPEDVGLLRVAMDRFFSRRAERGGDAEPFQIEFRMLSGGRIRTCLGVFLVTGEDTFLFCCGDVTAQRQ